MSTPQITLLVVYVIGCYVAAGALIKIAREPYTDELAILFLFAPLTLPTIGISFLILIPATRFVLKTLRITDQR